jgi:hypothetical protein
MPKKRGSKRRSSQARATPPWRDSIDPTDPRHQPRGCRESLYLALDLLELDEENRGKACEEVCAIAALYNSTAAVAISAPRFKSVEKRLLALRQVYATLAQELNSLDSATLNEIHDPRARDNQSLYRRAGAEWLREPHMRPFVQPDNFTLEFESPSVRAEAMTEYLNRVIDLL